MKIKPQFFFVSLLCCAVFMCATVRSFAQEVSQKEMEKDILFYVNKHRAEIDRPPLKLLNVITDEAIDHSENMAKHKVAFGHDGFEERAAYLKKKLKPFHSMGENVAYGHLSAEKVVNMWLKSGGHRKNIEGDYNYTGIGIAESKDGTIFFTQLFVLSND